MPRINPPRDRRLWIVPLLLGAFVVPMGLTRAFAADEETALEGFMNEINKEYKMLRRDARKGEFGAETGTRLLNMQVNAVKAMHERPVMLPKVPADKQKQFVIDYQKVTRDMVVHLLDMQIAYTEGRTEDFVKMIDAMGDIKSDGHDKFTAE